LAKKRVKANLEKFIKKIELKDKFIFQSLCGFALTAAQKNELVSVGRQFNISTNTSNDFTHPIIQNLLDDLVYPEVFHRIKNLKISDSFRLKQAHILFFSDTSKNKILLNTECKISALFKLTKTRNIQKGDPIFDKDVKEILKLTPSQNYEPNAAHIMLAKFRHRWFVAVDMIYDRKKISQRMNTADAFLASAKTNYEKKLHQPFIDNLLSATELPIQSILLLSYNPGYSTNQNHTKTKKLFKSYCKNGNVSIQFSNHYEKMYSLRKSARYGQGVRTSFQVNKINAEKYLDRTEGIINYAKQLLKIIDKNRQPEL